MAALVVYFSFEGNTKLIAETIVETIGADLAELKTSKEYPSEGFKKFFWGGKSVLFGEEPELTNAPFDLNCYDTIIIGTPVWFGSFAPPIKTFLKKYHITGKRISLFACHGGGGSKKCMANIKAAIPDNNFIGEIEFQDPKKNPEENTAKAVEWAKKLR